MNRKILKIIAIVIIIILALWYFWPASSTECTLVGSWRLTEENEIVLGPLELVPEDENIIFEFTADETYKIYEVDDGESWMEVCGDYEIEGDEISLYYLGE